MCKKNENFNSSKKKFTKLFLPYNEIHEKYDLIINSLEIIQIKSYFHLLMFPMFL